MDINNNNKSHPEESNNDDIRPPRVLSPQPNVHQKKYSQGTRVYRIFGEVNRIVNHIVILTKRKGMNY